MVWQRRVVLPMWCRWWHSPPDPSEWWTRKRSRFTASCQSPWFQGKGEFCCLQQRPWADCRPSVCSDTRQDMPVASSLGFGEQIQWVPIRCRPTLWTGTPEQMDQQRCCRLSTQPGAFGDDSCSSESHRWCLCIRDWQATRRRWQSLQHRSVTDCGYAPQLPAGGRQLTLTMGEQC